MNLLPIDYRNEQVFGVFTDCESFVEASGTGDSKGFVATYAAGNIVCADGIHGLYDFTWTVADEEFISLLTEYEVFEFLPDQSIRFVGMLTPGVDADTPDELNLFLGCMDNMDTATEMQATGLGPRADFQGFAFFTVESVSAAYANPEVWHCVSSFGTNQQITAITADNPDNLSHENWKVFDPTSGDGIERKMVAEWVPVNVVPGVAGAAPTLFDAEVRFWLDGRLVCKHLMRGVFQITTAGTTEMNFGLVGSNAAASSDTAALKLDLLKCDQIR